MQLCFSSGLFDQKCVSVTLLLLAARIPHLAPKALLPQPQDLKANLDRDEDDDRPLQKQTVLLTELFTQYTSDLLSVVHLLIEDFDPDARRPTLDQLGRSNSPG